MVAFTLPPVGMSPGLADATTHGDAGNRTPASNEAAEFSQALHVQREPDVSAAVVVAPGLGSHISAGLQEISSKLALWHTPASTDTEMSTGLYQAPDSAIPHTLTSAMTEAVAGLQGAYVFAIQATLVSRGSTEGTKILNTLLKGQ